MDRGVGQACWMVEAGKGILMYNKEQSWLLQAWALTAGMDGWFIRHGRNGTLHRGIGVWYICDFFVMQCRVSSQSFLQVYLPTRCGLNMISVCICCNIAILYSNDCSRVGDLSGSGPHHYLVSVSAQKTFIGLALATSFAACAAAELSWTSSMRPPNIAPISLYILALCCSIDLMLARMRASSCVRRLFRALSRSH